MPSHHVTVPYLKKIDFTFRLPDGTEGRMSALADPDVSKVEYDTIIEDTAFGPKITMITLTAYVESDSVRMHIMESVD